MLPASTSAVSCIRAEACPGQLAPQLQASQASQQLHNLCLENFQSLQRLMLLLLLLLLLSLVKARAGKHALQSQVPSSGPAQAAVPCQLLLRTRLSSCCSRPTPRRML